ncbi:hypothetical protein ATANTOWER_011931 [Ataeniobius toweri]|uniref:Uncharacterized protein n=1 Tax=Ataeniobius toweri TaxID=208326 RepID=A0ABU7BR57_9TELE|nr:hypothetical protein [Ataeniobius toweri]
MILNVVLTTYNSDKLSEVTDYQDGGMLQADRSVNRISCVINTAELMVATILTLAELLALGLAAEILETQFSMFVRTMRTYFMQVSKMGGNGITNKTEQAHVT